MRIEEMSNLTFTNLNPHSEIRIPKS